MIHEQKVIYSLSRRSVNSQNPGESRVTCPPEPLSFPPLPLPCRGHAVLTSPGGGLRGCSCTLHASSRSLGSSCLAALTQYVCGPSLLSHGTAGGSFSFPCGIPRAPLIAQFVNIYHISLICSSILAWRIPMDRGAWWAPIQGVSRSRPLIDLA